MKLRNFAYYLCIFVMALSCKSRNQNDGASTALEIQSGQRERIFVVVNGGWNSCNDTNTPVGSRTFDSANAMFERLSPKYDVHYVYSCLHKLPPWRPKAELTFMGRAIPVQTIAAPEWPAAVGQMISRIRPSRTFIVGHSYGGWVSLDLHQKGISSESTYLIDPIDAVRCLPVVQVSNAIGLAGDACKSAPDMPYDSMTDRFGQLYNFWQPFGDIHSTAIRSSSAQIINRETSIEHMSVLRDAPSKRDDAAHRLMGAFNAIWSEICASIQKSDDPSLCPMPETNEAGFVTFADPELDAIKCSKLFFDQQSQMHTWLVGVRTAGQKPAAISAWRDGVEYAGESDASTLSRQRSNGGSEVFGFANGRLLFQPNKDGRTGSGTFSIEHPSHGKREVGEMFCVTYNRERGADSLAEFDTPIRLGGEDSNPVTPPNGGETPFRLKANIASGSLQDGRNVYSGAVLQSVVAGGPAASAGLMAGDIVLSVDQQPVSSDADLLRILKDFGATSNQPKRRARLNVVRCRNMTPRRVCRRAETFDVNVTLER